MSVSRTTGFQMSVPDMFRSCVGNSGGFGLDEYRIPSTLWYSPKGHKFGKASRTDIHTRKQVPGPASYADTLESAAAQEWAKRSSKFPRAKRNTVTDDIMNTQKTLPGPTTYSSPSKLSKQANKFR